MIIWRGSGLIVVVYLLLTVWLSGYLFNSSLAESSLRFGVALIGAGFLMLLTMRKKKRNDEKYVNSPNEEIRNKYKKNIENNSMMSMTGHLFFIPLPYWQYVLWIGGITCIILHFLN